MEWWSGGEWRGRGGVCVQFSTFSPPFSPKFFSPPFSSFADLNPVTKVQGLSNASLLVEEQGALEPPVKRLMTRDPEAPPFQPGPSAGEAVSRYLSTFLGTSHEKLAKTCIESLGNWSEAWSIPSKGFAIRVDIAAAEKVANGTHKRNTVLKRTKDMQKFLKLTLVDGAGTSLDKVPNGATHVLLLLPTVTKLSPYALWTAAEFNGRKMTQEKNDMDLAGHIGRRVFEEEGPAMRADQQEEVEHIHKAFAPQQGQGRIPPIFGSGVAYDVAVGGTGTLDPRKFLEELLQAADQNSARHVAANRFGPDKKLRLTGCKVALGTKHTRNGTWIAWAALYTHLAYNACVAGFYRANLYCSPRGRYFVEDGKWQYAHKDSNYDGTTYSAAKMVDYWMREWLSGKDGQTYYPRGVGVLAEPSRSGKRDLRYELARGMVDVFAEARKSIFEKGDGGKMHFRTIETVSIRGSSVRIPGKDVGAFLQAAGVDPLVLLQRTERDCEEKIKKSALFVNLDGLNEGSITFTLLPDGKLQANIPFFASKDEKDLVVPIVRDHTFRSRGTETESVRIVLPYSVLTHDKSPVVAPDGSLSAACIDWNVNPPFCGVTVMRVHGDGKVEVSTLDPLAETAKRVEENLKKIDNLQKAEARCNADSAASSRKKLKEVRQHLQEAETALKDAADYSNADVQEMDGGVDQVAWEEGIASLEKEKRLLERQQQHLERRVASFQQRLKTAVLVLFGYDLEHHNRVSFSEGQCKAFEAVDTVRNADRATGEQRLQIRNHLEQQMKKAAEEHLAEKKKR